MAGSAKSTSKTKKKTTKSGASTSRRSSKRTSTTAKSSRTTTKKTTPKTTSVSQPVFTLTQNQKNNILGIIILVFSILTLISLFTSNAGTLPNWWAGVLYKGIGWGAYLFPLLLLLASAWLLLLRKRENFAKIAPARLIGAILFLFNLLAWFQLIANNLPNPNSIGGGVVGNFLLNTLTRWFGAPGALIWLIAWLLIALILLIDLSMAEVTSSISQAFKSLGTQISRVRSHSAARKAAQQATSAPTSTPSDFVAAPQSGAYQNAQPVQPAAVMPATQRAYPWILPNPEDILAPVTISSPDSENDQARARVIEETLHSFNTPAHVVEIRRGPAITLFGVEPDYIESRNGKTRVRVSNIVRLADDLAMALKASRIRIQAPVPGKGYVGIEVPNQKTELVSLLEIVQSPSFATNPDPLKFALGKNVAGQPFTTSLADMPHLLIAGTTNSGKSVCVNAILASYLLTLTPDQIRFVLVDPKRVELTGYNGVPHLLAPVIVDAEKVVGALQWMQREMDLRYRMFSETGVRNLVEYNQLKAAEGGKTLPFLLVVIDELADLMMLAPEETERALTRLAQLARATGIHLILSTQRPSADIITGLIKANFPARIAFAVASGVDSRVILDQPGAERLLGKGDMLFLAPDAAAPVRLQGTYVSDAEISRLTEFWRQQAAQLSGEERPDVAIFTAESHPPLINPTLVQQPLWQELEKESLDSDADPITNEALKIIRREGRASVSMLQRKLRIGYTRAARIIDALEEQGIVGPPDTQTGVREVLDYGKYGPVNED
jgi:S-DNA-T family DNA segregation ATPase FtsK/SpoIIIE